MYRERAKISAVKTADALIIAGPASIAGFAVVTDGSNDATIEIFNGIDGTATIVAVPELVVAGSELRGGIIFPAALLCDQGIYVKFSGTGASYLVYYIRD